MSVAAVVVAAGRGLRFGGAKQFATLDDLTVTAHSVRAARSVAQRVILVVPDDYRGDGEGADVLVVGGASRAASVRSGLRECADVDIIVVHDAARPLATPALFSAVVQAVSDGADAAVPGLAITDTVKRIERLGEVTVVRETISRDELVTVQTPQAFRRDTLLRAHQLGDDATDDAALVEAIGGRVVIVPGEIHNLKITEPEDLVRASRQAGDRP
ncbi:MAG: 2-C-methyl-D-erythritol 4-phosphate cytidylyltransferase [Acidimicrobiaceae bacterium]|nr:2-C-methyl-D-erythritol 4-phosphate cytidylyltransferase [Acidimicrobiaceae bacterium]